MKMNVFRIRNNGNECIHIEISTKTFPEKQKHSLPPPKVIRLYLPEGSYGLTTISGSETAQNRAKIREPATIHNHCWGPPETPRPLDLPTGGCG